MRCYWHAKKRFKDKTKYLFKDKHICITIYNKIRNILGVSLFPKVVYYTQILALNAILHGKCYFKS